MGQTAKDFVKTSEEIGIMRQGGQILGVILFKVKALIRPGLDVWALEEAFLSLCQQNNVKPSCKGYDPYGFSPFPTGLCVSINSQCVHCFPKKGVVLKDGDVVTIDTAISYKGLYVDSAFAVAVGKSSNKDKKLVETTEKALYAAINEIANDIRIGKISNKLQRTVERVGFNVLKDYAGHGIGKEMHEWPQILCYGSKNYGPKLKTGMTICVESLVCTGNDKVQNVTLWETKMKDGGKFAQFEHTVLVKHNGYEILTLPK